MASTMRSYLGIYCVIIYTVVVFGAEISIKPIGDRQEKALGVDQVLTCVINAENRNQITNFKWLDPHNITIDPNYRKQNPRIYSTYLGTSGTQLQLFINKLMKEDAGKYTCTANYGAEQLSASVVLEFYQMITFVNAPPEQKALSGTRYKIKCQVEAQPPPTVEWTRNDQKLTNDPRYTIEPDGLVIDSVSEADDGEYRCEVVVVEKGETKNRDIRLEVTTPPKIINTADFVKVTEGEKAQLKCEAIGKPKPTITWTKTNTRQVVAEGTDGMLYIEKVVRGETTDYTCEAKNTAGEDSRNIHLNIRSKPEVYDVRNSTAKVGGFAQIQCYVYANPKPSVIIRKLALPRSTRSADSSLRTTVDTVDAPNKTFGVIATMNFTNVELVDDGLYECIATNEVGQSVRSVHLTVEYPPIIDPAVNINTTFSWDRRPVNLTCIAEAIPNATISWYYNNRVIERSDGIYTIFSKASPSILQVKPNDRDRYGIYKCQADNYLGRAEWTINLKEAFPPQPLENVEVNATTATSITFRIVDPINVGGLPIKGYVVQFWVPPQEPHEGGNQTWPRGALYSLQGLLPGRRYKFRFAAINEVGMGPWGRQEERLMPEQSAPSEAIITNVINEGEKFIKLDTATTLELKWKIPSSNGVDIDSYKLEYCTAAEDSATNNLFEITTTCVTENLSVNQDLSSYVIKNLSPDTYYRVSLRAHNNIGDGPANQRFFKTNISTQPAPTADAKMSSAVLIYIVVAILLALLVIVDVFCFFFGKTGVLHLICGACCGKKSKNTDDKLGTSETKDLISNGHKKGAIDEQSPMIVEGTKKDTAVEYDPKKGTAKTGFVGKDSAV